MAANRVEVSYDRPGEPNRQLVQQIRDNAGEWLATWAPINTRGGLDMAQAQANINDDFDNYSFVGREGDGRAVAIMAIIDQDAEFLDWQCACGDAVGR